MRRLLATLVMSAFLGAASAAADEEPISGTVKAVDPTNQTLIVQTTAKGKTREVTVTLRPDTRIVRFARSTEPGKTGFVEQAIPLGDLKPGWVVSVTAKHEGEREIAEVVKVVLER